ncbi:hypothetical protein V491_03944 [Pseudogymnoascus sp. VKM F-3775]|nr:hypothetical protein V491_03944 [Pseudogymnoascus sp. VKM F-3775]
MQKWPKIGTTPPGVYKYTRTLELSLSPDFPRSIICANYDLPGIEERHEVYDFHWLHLDRFQNLRNLNIWVSARSVNMSLNDTDETYDFTGITEFDFHALQQILAHLDSVAKVTLSTPLGSSVGPEEGYVEGLKARVYKRGSGDRFHPPLYPIRLGGTFDGVIHTSSTRDVRLSRNGNDHVAMKSV